ISDGVHASIAPKQIACKVVITPPWVSPPSATDSTGKWNFCSKTALVAAVRAGTRRRSARAAQQRPETSAGIQDQRPGLSDWAARVRWRTDMRTKPDQTSSWALPISSGESPVRLPRDGAFVWHMLLMAALAVIWNLLGQMKETAN
ncbi:MAG: hypothetical protein WBF73_28970, partial [Bradyrhizobium sp.]